MKTFMKKLKVSFQQECDVKYIMKNDDGYTDINLVLLVTVFLLLFVAHEILWTWDFAF